MSVRRKLGAQLLVAATLVCVSLTPATAAAYHDTNWPPNQEESPPQDEWPPPEENPPPADEWSGSTPPQETYVPPAPTTPETTPAVPVYQPPTYDPSTDYPSGVTDPRPETPEPVIRPVKGAIALKVLSTGDVKTPSKASRPIRKMVAAANRINGLRYRYGGSHGNSFFNSNPRSFDCSSAVSYVLYAAGLISGPFDSGGLAHWGKTGPGKQLTIYANREHAFMVIGNLRFDTGRAAEIFGKQSSGPRWGLLRPTERFKVRHYPGL